MPSETYILSLHDALPISLTKLATKDLVPGEVMSRSTADADSITRIFGQIGTGVSALTGFAVSAIFLLFSDWLVGLIVLIIAPRSEEHTSELQSRGHLVCPPRPTFFPYTTLFRSR